MHKLDITKDLVALQRVREAAEKAKIELSSTAMADINILDLVADKHCELKLSRAKLEEMTDDFLKKTIKPCEECLKDCGISKE